MTLQEIARYIYLECGNMICGQSREFYLDPPLEPVAIQPILQHKLAELQGDLKIVFRESVVCVTRSFPPSAEHNTEPV